MELPDTETTSTNTPSHLLFVGDGWVPATKVPCDWSDEDDYAWEFCEPTDAIRWLMY